VVTERQRGGTGGKESFDDFRRGAAPAGGILGIGDHEIYPAVRAEPLGNALKNLPTCAADHITRKKNLHAHTMP